MDDAGDKCLIGNTQFHRFLLNALVIMVIEANGDPSVLYQGLSGGRLYGFKFLPGRSRWLHLSFLVGINNDFFLFAVFHVSLALPLLFVCLGCLSTRDNGLQKDVIFFNNMRNKVDVFLHNHEVYSLSGIVLLIGVIGKFPDVTTG